jgi:LPXTG-motif cell wall-anchored protein
VIELLADLPLQRVVVGTAYYRSTTVTASATGFQPGERVHLILTSIGLVIASDFADAGGNITLSGRVPDDIQTGRQEIAVWAPASGGGARQSIIVLADRSLTLPTTGAEIASSLTLALLMLLLGGILVVLRRTPRRT